RSREIRADRHTLRRQTMVFDPARSNGPKRGRAHVERQRMDGDSARTEPLEHTLAEVQSSRRCGNGARGLRVDGLISLAVFGLGLPMAGDVRRQRWKTVTIEDLGNRRVGALDDSRAIRLRADDRETRPVGSADAKLGSLAAMPRGACERAPPAANAWLHE